MMRSATAFLPDSMITFMNLERSTEPNFGSGRISRLGTSRRRGISLFLLLQLARTFARASGATDFWGHPLTRPIRAESFNDLQAVFPVCRRRYAFFGRFAPYLERDCLRSFTPCRSSEPRTM